MSGIAASLPVAMTICSAVSVRPSTSTLPSLSSPAPRMIVAPFSSNCLTFFASSSPLFM